MYFIVASIVVSSPMKDVPRFGPRPIGTRKPCSKSSEYAAALSRRDETAQARFKVADCRGHAGVELDMA